VGTSAYRAHQSLPPRRTELHLFPWLGDFYHLGVGTASAKLFNRFLLCSVVGMCNDYEQHIAWAQYRATMQTAQLGIPTRQTEADLPIADDIKINDVGAVMRASGNLIELTRMNFSFPPSGRGGPVFNFKSEGRSFAKSNRCLIPASAFFEFTGKKYPKAKHRFTLEGAPFLAIAGLWREGKGNARPAFAMLTTSPGPDVKPYHPRQIVILRPQDWAAWIYLTKPEAELLRPLSEGSLEVETIRAGTD
jgi:putative SOS response-associated peptidase YedK